jgi:hypothetical protein
MTEVTRRKLAKAGDAQISAIIREALAAYLTKELTNKLRVSISTVRKLSK